MSIIIVGAGLGGLSLARILQMNGRDVTILEAEPDRNARDQGGSLDMHEESGLLVLNEIGLRKEFNKHVREEAEWTKMLSQDGTVLRSWQGGPPGQTRPEIDRAILRSMLLDSLRPGTVQWNSKVTSIRYGDSGKAEITLSEKEGRILSANLVVGADGAWSKVRSLLTDEKPSYTGITMIEAQFSEVDNNHPDIATLIGPGSFMAMGPSRGFFCHRLGNGGVRVYISVQKPLTWIQDSGINWKNPKEAKTALLAEFSGWSPQLLDLIKKCDEDEVSGFVTRNIFALPPDINWQSQSSVTVLGDAAHLMSPFAGEGANMAMLDGLTLGKAILKHEDIATAIAEYEKTMHETAGEQARDSAENLEFIFREDSPSGLIKKMDDMIAMMMAGGPPQ